MGNTNPEELSEDNRTNFSSFLCYMLEVQLLGARLITLATISAAFPYHFLESQNSNIEWSGKISSTNWDTTSSCNCYTITEIWVNL